MKIFDSLLIDLIGRRQDLYGWRSYQRPLEIHAVESVCLLSLANKLGDSIVLSLLVDALAKSRPGLPILVGTTPAYLDYWASHPSVSEAFVVPKSRSIFRKLSKPFALYRVGRRFRGRFDVLISVKTFNRPEHFALVRGMAARTTIGFNKLQYRLFDHSVDERCHGADCQPIASRTTGIMKVFGLDVPVEGLVPHVPFGKEDLATAQRALAKAGACSPRMLLSVYGSNEDRKLNPASIVLCVRAIRQAGFDGCVFVSVPKDDVYACECALSREQLQTSIEIVGPQPTLGALFAFVASMDFVVSVDSAVGHIAAAFSKPQVVLFSRGFNFPTVWKPLNDLCGVLVSRVDEDVNGIDWKEFQATLAMILSEASRTCGSR